MNNNTAAKWAATVRERLEALEAEVRTVAPELALDPAALLVALDRATLAALNVAPAVAG